MSFRIDVKSCDRYGIGSAVNAELERQFAEQGRPELEAEVRDAVEHAVRAADLLARGIGDGRPDWRLDVTISGHVNRGHVLVDGWAADFVSVEVSNASPMPAERKRQAEEAESAAAAEKAAVDARAREVGREEASREHEAGLIEVPAVETSNEGEDGDVPATVEMPDGADASGEVPDQSIPAGVGSESEPVREGGSAEGDPGSAPAPSASTDSPAGMHAAYMAGMGVDHGIGGAVPPGVVLADLTAEPPARAAEES